MKIKIIFVKNITNHLINIKNYKINLQGCKNKHIFNNILLNKYEETQEIDLSKILCDICN